MLRLLRHHRHRIAWLPLLLMLASGLSLFAQGCLAAASSAPDHANHGGHGSMPCCEQPGDCGDGFCLEPACPGMQSADRQAPPAFAEVRIPSPPEAVAILAVSPPPLPPAVSPRWIELAPDADPGKHPAQRFHRLRI